MKLKLMRLGFRRVAGCNGMGSDGKSNPSAVVVGVDWSVLVGVVGGVEL